LVFSLVPGIILAESGNPYEKIFTDENGNQITIASFPLPPPKTKVAAAAVPDVHIAGAVNTLSDVPAFYWSYGCSATAAAMLFGYYDRTGYDDMYTGPTNGGVCPLDNTGWGYTHYPIAGDVGECPLSATHNGTDGRAINGHVDDYWIDYNEPGPDPWVGSGPEHTVGDCTADYMGTNQWKYGSPIAYNHDGETLFFWYTNGDPLYDYTGDEPTYRDGCHGMKLFAESRGYTVVTNFTQMIKGQGSDPSKGFTFADFQAEIDAGRPVIIQVTGHSMLGYGYNTTGNLIYVHDTWDYSNHTMTWGGTYSGLQHRAVTVIRLGALPPDPPSDLTATAVSSSQIDLAWTDNSSDETGFKIERKTSSGGTYTQIATVGANVTSYNNTYLTADTTYYYRVRAYSAAGNSDYSNEAHDTTLPPPPSAPVLTSPSYGETVSTLTPRLEWNASSGATEYGIQVATDYRFTNLVVDQTGITNLYYDIPGGSLSWGTRYYWRANASNSFGSTSSWSSYRYFQTAVGPPPDPPTDLTATAVSSSQIDLAWTDNSSDETGFKIERKTSSGGTYTQIATVGANVTSYNNTYLTADTTYYYRVRAYSAAGNSDYSNEAHDTTLPPPPSAPVLTSPSYGETVSTLTPRLEWNASSGATEYGIQVATDYRFTNLVVDQTGITNLYYDIPGGSLSWGTRYYWRANASNSFGSTSSWSSYRYFQTAVGPPNTPEPISPGTTITFTWSAPSGATKYYLQVNTDPAFTGTSLFDGEVGNVTSKEVTGLTMGTTYYWRVKAGSTGGWSDWSSVRSVIASEVP
jgi:hypothetical protein